VLITQQPQPSLFNGIGKVHPAPTYQPQSSSSNSELETETECKSDFGHLLLRRFKSSAVEWCAHFRTRLENCVSRWAIKLANGRGAATLLPLNQRIWFWPAFRRRGWVVHAINPMIVRQNQEVMGFISQPIYQCTSGKLEENMFSLSGYPHWLLFCSIFIITFLVSQYFSFFFIWVERWITCKVVIMDSHCFEVFKCLWNL